MVLAVDALSAGWQAVFYAIACLCFGLAFLLGNVWVAEGRRPILSWGGLVALGLFFAFFPSFYNNLALS